MPLLALKNARAEAEDGYRTLAALGREEAQQRERTIESLQRERAVFFNKTLFLMVGAGTFGALLAGVANETARWLWATTFLAAPSSVADGLRWPRGGTHERRMAMSIDEPRARAPKRGLPITERLLRRFTDAAREAQMSTQRATNEALKAWMASRPAEEQRGVALKASLRALAASEKQKRLTRRAAVGGHVKVRNSRQASTAVTAVSVSWSVAVSG